MRIYYEVRMQFIVSCGGILNAGLYAYLERRLQICDMNERYNEL